MPCQLPACADSTAAFENTIILSCTQEDTNKRVEQAQGNMHIHSEAPDQTRVVAGIHIYIMALMKVIKVSLNWAVAHHRKVEKWRSSRRMVTKGSITDCNVSKKSSIIFQRDTSKCSSLPYLHDNKRYVSASTLSNKSRSYLEPLKQHKNGDTYAMLPQSIRQTYTPSPIPSLQQDTSADCHVPPTGSSGYHRLTGYTARHLPNPTSSRTVTTFVVYIHEYA